ncbi:hypothetical protein EON64_01425 [archaeon]|nr:MAG: hypothetical protein EON64_01425 [archaeon]
MSLYEQIFYELLEAGERDLAKEILRQTDPLQSLKHTHPDRYSRLESLARRPYFASSEVYEMGQTRDSRRTDLSLSLAAEVGTADPSRLLALLSLAMRHQLSCLASPSSPSLPSGTQFDILRGTKKMHRREAEEKIVRHMKDTLSSLQGGVTLCLYSPGGDSLCLGDRGGQVEVRDTDTLSVRPDLPYQSLKAGSAVLAGCYSRDGDHVALGTEEGVICIYRISTGAMVKQFSSAHHGSVLCVCFARDGGTLLSSSSDATCRLHGLKSGKTIKEFR